MTGRDRAPAEGVPPAVDDAPADDAVARTVVGSVVAVLAVATRFVGLERAPAAWYGDISTLYETVLAGRDGRLPDGYYVLGVGPLYPLAIRPFLWLFGDTYLAIKIASATFSLLGLCLLFRLAKELVDPWFGLLVAAVAAVGPWWLAYSRLGDLQGLTPTLTLAAVLATVLAVRRPTATWPALLAGGAAGLGLYLYGNTFVLPVITVGLLAVAWRTGRTGSRPLVLHLGALAAVLAPYVLETVRHRDAVAGGHNGDRLVVGDRFLPNLVEGFGRSAWAYVGAGDPGFRGHPAGAAHIDRLSALLLVVGVAYWLRPERRRMGLALVATFVLLHLPAVLAGEQALPSVSRTVAAAPFAYLFVASGIWWAATLVRPRVDGRAAGATAAVAVLVLAVVGLGQYRSAYLDGLPYGNRSISGAIVEVAEAQPDEVTVHLVGTDWEADMPEVKSVGYPLGDLGRVVEHDPATFDCDELALVARPALVVWDFEVALPGAPGALAGCAADLAGQQTYHEPDGTPLFNGVILR